MSASRIGAPAPVGAQRPQVQDASAAAGLPKWHLRQSAVAIAVVALAGVLVFLYPGAASWFSQYDQSQTVVGLQEAVVSTGATEMQQELAAARAYNDELVSGALIAANARKPIAEGQATDNALYGSLLQGDAAGAMGRLRIAKIGVDLPIYHGTSDVTLTKGVGHLQGTSLPVGGESQHSVLTAHRGLAEATLFDRLDEIAVGDTFQLEVFGEVLTYRVSDTKVVEPENTESLYPRYGADLVTLVTCTPLGINSHRILVTGERVTPTPIADIARVGEKPNIPGFPWWAAGVLLTITVLSLYVWQAGRPRSTPDTSAVGVTAKP